MISKSVIETLHGHLYLKKLCKHFAHKVPATFNDTQGLIEFPFGTCRIEIDDVQMTLLVETEDSNQIELGEKAIKDHLSRMAHKEPINIEWQRESLEVTQQ